MTLTEQNTLLVRLRGSAVPEKTTVKIYSLSTALANAPSIGQPDKMHFVKTAQPHARDSAIELKPYTVAVVEIVRDCRCDGVVPVQRFCQDVRK